MSQSFPPSGWLPPPQGGYTSPYVAPGYWSPAYGNWAPKPPAPEPIGSDRPPVRSAVAGTVLAWVVIVASVAAVVTRDSWAPALARRAMGEERYTAAKAKAEQGGDIADHRSPQLLLGARYAVGVQSFMKSAPRAAATRATTSPATTRAATAAAAGGPDLTAKLLDQLDITAQSPVDEFRVIPVVGELLGSDAALDRLDRFEREHTVVRLRRDVDLLRAAYAGGSASLNASDRQYLIERHGWFAQLTLAHDAPSNDLQRQEVLGPARRTAGLLLTIVVAGIAALVAGVALLILVVVWLIGGKWRAGYVRPAPWRAGPFGESFALYLGGYLVLSLGISLLLGGSEARSVWPSAALLLILPLVVIWLFMRGISGREVALGLGWNRGRGALRECFAGITGYVAGLPLIGAAMLVSMWLMKHSGQKAEHPIVNHPIDRPLEAWGVFVLACIVAPILEESMFRGALFHHLRGKLGFILSALISSLIFAAIHPQGWAAVPVLSAIAFVLAGIRQWRGSLIGCVVAHALNNGIVTLILLVGMR